RALGPHRRPRRRARRAAPRLPRRGRARRVPARPPRGGSRALSRPLARRGEAPRQGRVRAGAAGPRARRPLRARRARLHPRHRAQPPLPRPDHARAGQGGAAGTGARIPGRGARCPRAALQRAVGTMRTRRLVLAVLAALAFVTGASAAPPKDAIVIGLVAEPVTMDPPQITDLNSARVTKRIFEGLVGQELGSYKLVPALAHSWDISKDGLTYTFKLRPNVKFHDGTPFNAEAVKFVFERQLNDKGPYYA